MKKEKQCGEKGQVLELHGPGLNLDFTIPSIEVVRSLTVSELWFLNGPLRVVIGNK